ncbi:hypothetical protein [Kumtagia ephedrae]|uniref:Uncharacterized protein n=1 Tax=Kumtagia ephedrae TaxID=2116701 RepID=A0A2P7SCD3_9HYPH|nr:hypothetical protein [Mesorhizobium ephedrae]PSJ59981.1 hypothetical protein C7I84_11780 [Mesorhizobium ephedrae]
MISDSRLKSEIEKVVREQVHSGKVTDVAVKSGTGSDGDEIIRVHVVYESKSSIIDAQETVNVMRNVRGRLEKMGDDRFPVFYYVATSEVGKIAESR